MSNESLIGGRDPKGHSAAVGRRGESIAAMFMERHGARVVDRNVRVGHDEIDLLVELDGRRVAVEVKTAVANGAIARPEEAFDDVKVRRIRRAASGLDPPAARIDLITVIMAVDGVDVRWSPGAG
jgi:putative endonuclease